MSYFRVYYGNVKIRDDVDQYWRGPMFVVDIGDFEEYRAGTNDYLNYKLTDASVLIGTDAPNATEIRCRVGPNIYLPKSGVQGVTPPAFYDKEAFFRGPLRLRNVLVGFNKRNGGDGTVPEGRGWTIGSWVFEETVTGYSSVDGETGQTIYFDPQGNIVQEPYYTYTYSDPSPHIMAPLPYTVENGFIHADHTVVCPGIGTVRFVFTARILETFVRSSARKIVGGSGGSGLLGILLNLSGTVIQTGALLPFSGTSNVITSGPPSVG